MKQILQNLKSGETLLEEIPCPQVLEGQVLIETQVSLLSAGTERMLLNFGKAGWIGKIKQQPDKVKQVLEKIKTDGLLTTLDAVQAKLEQPITLGYCNVGQVVSIGAGVQHVSPGDRVVSNGSHAEVVRIPKNLTVKVPDSVSNEEAVFTVLGAIGLQGIRLLDPHLGETVVVLGLGLIGLLSVQLLLAHGCRVLGVDFDSDKLELAKQFGAEICNLSLGEDVVSQAMNFSRGRGVDGVLITAATQSSDPVHQAATMCRQRGRIVLVGVTGLHLFRDDFYKKELSFQVSCSYGPGRYDPEYEERGHDYPLGFVRWTEQRNFEAVLDMMAAGKLNVKPLISHTFEMDQVQKAYETLEQETSTLGILLQYPVKNQSEKLAAHVFLSSPSQIKNDKKSSVCAFIGAGNYASRMLIPAFKKAGAVLQTLVSSQGVSSVTHGKKHGFKEASTNYDDSLQDPKINTVVIATRHHQHANQVIEALQQGKHVFVEKPLVINQAQLDAVKLTYEETQRVFPGQKLMVGFNRRFAPQVQKMDLLLQSLRVSKIFVMTINAGVIPKEHWTQDAQVGAGRLIGEACHFVDLLRFLAHSPIQDTHIQYLGAGENQQIKDENVTIALKFRDGSIGTIHYIANGHKSFPKERLEVFAGGKVLQLDNFRQLYGYGWSDFKKMKLWKQDKGQNQCAAAFIASIQGQMPSPISAEELFEVAQVCLQLVEHIQ